MRLFRNLLLLFLTVSIAAPLPQLAQGQNQEKGSQEAAKPADPMSSGTFAGLKLRSIGPALTSGRIIAFAVNPNDRSHYFVAAASGGVWKTTNAGTTWQSVFDKEGSYSIGAIAMDTKNPAVIWVGTGECNSQRSVSYGDGIYRSEDGGKSWKNVGLKTSEHIGRIVIDPRNSNTVYVAAQGPLWGAGGDRGLFKTTDSGASWKNVLSISENTGVTDIVLDPVNPDVIYAAAYQRRRHVWTLIDGGPESALYKSVDAGANWTKLKSGLPTEELGRIGLAISPVDNKVIYATVEAARRKGGIFRSTDYGVNWERRNDFDRTAMYYSQIIADPKNVDRIYVMNVLNMVSDDGGKTLRPLGERNKHVDNHAFWVDPKNTNYYLSGCDGGVYESFDRGATWSFKSNMPITQFYNVTVDNATPFYNVYGGTQDNFTLGGPSRTQNVSGIANSDWFVTVGGDGFRCQVDPSDPNIVYSESQYGGLIRYDKRTGARVGIKPQDGKGEEPLRWNWDSPLIISPHSPSRLYFAANKLFRSDDRGDTWKQVSGELSRALDRDKLPVMGKIWGPDAVAKHASTSFFGNITAVAESPKKEGLLYTGSDDGLIHVSENGGTNWRKIEKFPGVPEMAYVSRILASQHETNHVYAAFDNHKNSDFAPYLLRSTDAGRSWTSVKGDLPANGPVLAIAEDHINPNLLFVGTEFGLFFSINGGQKWIKLTGGMPTISVRDLVIQKRENDLVVATFGRGIYILDNYMPLRTVKPEMLQQESLLFPVKDALMYIEAEPLGGRGRVFQGEAYYVADNPPYGATFTYYLKESLKTKKEKRQEAEKEAEKKGSAPSFPTRDQLREEEEEEASAILFTVYDATGKVVRKLTGPTSAGINRISWDLRFPAPDPPRQRSSDDNPSGDEPQGPLVLPGRYKVTIAKRVNGVQTPLASPQEFNVVVEGVAAMSEVDRNALYQFQRKAVRLYRALLGAIETGNSLRTRLGSIKQALQQTSDIDHHLHDDAVAIERRLNNIMRNLRGDNILRARNENVPTSILDRVEDILEGQRLAAARPTQTHLNGYQIAAQEFGQQLTDLHKLVEVDLVKLEKEMEAAGAPWTPGRVPDWKDE
ncbi:MAG: glycosyl hydrolase [Acidobacteriota bacterium]